MSNRAARIAVATVAALLAVTAPAAADPAPAGTARHRCPLPVFGPGGTYHPHIDPGAFSANVTNDLFPLRPGRTLVFRGRKDGKAALDIVVNSSRTQIVDGVLTRVVEDRLYLNDVLEERTSDYYAQDRCGNVWYFGEDTATLDRKGRVTSTEGSFRAGVDGAQPGVLMAARPVVGRTFRQEWYAGHAEDRFAVTDLAVPVQVPYGSFRQALRTTEQTGLEPGVLDEKFYVTGIGVVSERAVRGPAELLQLVEIIE